MRKVSPVKVLNQNRPASMIKTIRNSPGKDIFSKIKKSRMGFGQLSGRFPGMIQRRPKYYRNIASPEKIEKQDMMPDMSKVTKISPLINQKEEIFSNKDNTLTPLSHYQAKLNSENGISSPI